MDRLHQIDLTLERYATRPSPYLQLLPSPFMLAPPQVVCFGVPVPLLRFGPERVPDRGSKWPPLPRRDVNQTPGSASYARRVRARTVPEGLSAGSDHAVGWTAPSSINPARECSPGQCLRGIPAVEDRCWRPRSGEPERRDIRHALIHGPPSESMPTRMRRDCCRSAIRQSASQFDSESSVIPCPVTFLVESGRAANRNPGDSIPEHQGAVDFHGPLVRRESQEVDAGRDTAGRGLFVFVNILLSPVRFSNLPN
jgi:hypothetical protein